LNLKNKFKPIAYIKQRINVDSGTVLVIAIMYVMLNIKILLSDFFHYQKRVFFIIIINKNYYSLAHY